MYPHHVSSAGRPLNSTSSSRATPFSLAITTARKGLVAVIPVLLFALILLCCIQGIKPAAEAATTCTANSPLDQPPVIASSPGRYLHVTGRVRLAPDSGFADLSARAEFVPIEFWFNEQIASQWCVASPYALAYTASRQGFLFTHCKNAPSKVEQIPVCAYSYVPSVGYFLWGRELFPLEYSVARCRRQNITSSINVDESGREITTVVILPSKSEYCQRNTAANQHDWFNPAFKKTYVFDTKTHDLKSACISTSVNGTSVTLFETSSIVYKSSSVPPSSIATAIEKFVVQAIIDKAGSQSATF